MSEDTACLLRILQNCATIAVVGLSAERHRPSFSVAKYMQEHGYRIVPVNPKYTEILDETCYASLSAIPFPVDMVNVFRKTEDVLPIAEEAIRIGAKCLWQQLGVENWQAAELVQQAGMDAVVNRCFKIEHARLFSGLYEVGLTRS